jgi:hypothetical protein
MITAVIKDDRKRKTTIRIEYGREETLVCPVCGQEAKLYDHRIRKLRYLDTCQYETFLEVYVPRVKCKGDGVEQLAIPFAEKHSRFTSRFERAVAAWLRDSPISAVAENFNPSWDERDGIDVMGLCVHESGRGGVEETAEVDKPVPAPGDDTGRKDGAELFMGDTERDTAGGNEWGA